MAMQNASIVATTVISRLDITRTAPMNEEQFSSELDYQVSLTMAKNLLQAGLISDEEFSKMRALLLEKYTPVLGNLFAELG